ncbi:hypothetical protein ACKFKF_23770 [Phormidesmis sp. 146-12]
MSRSLRVTREGSLRVTRNSPLRVILAIVLTGLLTACGASGLPNTSLVRKAIAMQVSQTQQEISQQLRLDPPKVEVDRIQIKTRSPLTIQNLTAYRIEGTYDFTLKLRDRKVAQKDNPFEVYLQRQLEGKTWRVAQPQKESGWITTLVE